MGLDTHGKINDSLTVVDVTYIPRKGVYEDKYGRQYHEDEVIDKDSEQPWAFVRSSAVVAAAEKPTNPKDAVGIAKVPLSTVPATVLMEIGLGMAEGAIKYGRHNYRSIGVRSSVYYDATVRHLTSWWEGEDLDPDSGLSHISKAIASLVVLRDAMIQGKLNDDRPPASPKGWINELNSAMKKLLDKYAGTEHKAAYTEQTHPSGNKQ